MKELDFNTPEELMEYIQMSTGQTFKYVKWHGGITTSHSWNNQALIVIHWRGTITHITSLFELIEMYKKGTIFMIKESIEVTYKPFAAVKKRKLTQKEYEFLESANDVDTEFFVQFELERENHQKFEAYLEKEKKKKIRKRKSNQEENIG